jgi:hypothetical protein
VTAGQWERRVQRKERIGGWSSQNRVVEIPPEVEQRGQGWTGLVFTVVV